MIISLALQENGVLIQEEYQHTLASIKKNKHISKHLAQACFQFQQSLQQIVGYSLNEPDIKGGTLELMNDKYIHQIQMVQQVFQNMGNDLQRDYLRQNKNITQIQRDIKRLRHQVKQEKKKYHQVELLEEISQDQKDYCERLESERQRMVEERQVEWHRVQDYLHGLVQTLGIHQSQVLQSYHHRFTTVQPQERVPQMSSMSTFQCKQDHSQVAYSGVFPIHPPSSEKHIESSLNDRSRTQFSKLNLTRVEALSKVPHGPTSNESRLVINSDRDNCVRLSDLMRPQENGSKTIAFV